MPNIPIVEVEKYRRKKTQQNEKRVHIAPSLVFFNLFDRNFVREVDGSGSLEELDKN